MGFYYLQSRYYDPNLCRFINADGLASTGQGFLGCNMFAYCNNNPVNGADPRGQWMWYIDADGNCLPTDFDSKTDYIVSYFHPKSDGNFDEVAKRNKYSTRYVIKYAGTKEEFLESINDVPACVNNIYIYVHGSFGALEFYRESLTPEEINNGVNSISISGSIYLFACHGSFTAESLAIATGQTVYASTYSVSFEDGYARNALSWALPLGLFGGYMQGWYAFYANGTSKKYTDDIYIYTP